MRFHLLGLAHIPTNKEYSACAYTQKVYKLAHMLKSLGHTVFFYGGEGSDVECDEFIQVVSNDTRIQTYGDYDWRKEFFKHDPKDLAHTAFNNNAISEINKRKEPKDFLLVPMGNYQKSISDSTGLMTVESGIGYSGIFSKFKVFESYAWMHYLYGVLNKGDGDWYDSVIPNYYDPNDFKFQEEKEDYLLFVGRLIHRKGVDVAIQVANMLGKKLKIAGQGGPDNPSEGIYLSDKPYVEYLGTVGPEERSELMGKAKAVFVPTYYIEPFGGVAVEAQMCGTPVVTTDWGAFTETVNHGVTGYRCRSMEQFTWAINNIDTIKPEDCREWAVSNYSMDRIAKMYDEYFHQLHNLWEGGWYQPNNDRSELDWLRKYHGGN